jgi:hypothetical protein
MDLLPQKHAPAGALLTSANAPHVFPLKNLSVTGWYHPAAGYNAKPIVAVSDKDRFLGTRATTAIFLTIGTIPLLPGQHTPGLVPTGTAATR